MEHVKDEFIRNYLDNMNIDVLYVEMNRTEHKVLKTIEKLEEKNKDVVYLAALAEHLNISVVNASKMVKLLNEKGYIIWAMDREKKNTTVRLSKNGKRLLELQDNRLYNVINSVFETLDEAEKKLLQQVAGKLYEIIDTHYSLKPGVVEV